MKTEATSHPILTSLRLVLRVGVFVSLFVLANRGLHLNPWPVILLCIAVTSYIVSVFAVQQGLVHRVSQRVTWMSFVLMLALTAWFAARTAL